MRITIVSPFDPLPPTGQDPRNAHVGGVERVLGEVAANLAQRGHDVSLICSTRGPATHSTRHGVQIHRVKRATTLFRTPVVNLAKKLDPGTDIVQVPATYPFTTGPVLRAANTIGIGSVLDFHFEPSPPGMFGKLASRAYRVAGTRSYRLADAVIVRSYSYGRSAPSLQDVPESRWRVVPNGIDMNRFTSAGRMTGAKDRLLFVGRLVPYKGLDVLLRALARLHSAPPLVVAGDGPMRRRLEALAQDLGVDARFLGHVPDADLPALYRGARLTVLPSVNQQEAFGIALVESMACGTPVVASDLPGVADVARIGGLVARAGDPEDLAQKIQQALRPAAVPAGAALSQSIRQSYSWDAITKRFLAVYEEVLSRRGRTPGLRPSTEVTTNANPRRNAVL
jgi:glycosyltransferase involved in cell wall biosynthesis